MKKIKAFFYVCVQSCTNPSYYKKILASPFGFSLKYLVFLLFLLSLVLTGKAAYTYTSLSPKISEILPRLKEEGEKFYPQGLEVTVRDGVVSTNVREPYVIDFPKLFSDIPVADGMHLLTIDTNAQAADFDSYKSLVVVGNNVIYFKDSQGNKFYSLGAHKGTILINKSQYEQWLSVIIPYIDRAASTLFVMIGWLLLFLPFVITGFDLAGRLTYLLLLSVIVFLIAKIFRKRVGYWDVYHMGMHGITVPILTVFLFGIFRIHIGFLFTGLFLVWMMIVLSRLDSTKAHKPAVRKPLKKKRK